MPGLAGDMGCASAGQKLNHGSDVAGVGDAAQGHLLGCGVDVVLAHALARLSRVGDAGCDGIDPNAVGRQRRGAGPRQTHQARFAGDVMGRAKA